MAIPQRYESRSLSWAFQKNSPFLGLFNHFLIKMRDEGTLQKIIKSYLPPRQICPNYSGKPLTMRGCFTAFFIIIFGLSLAMISLVIEKVKKYYDQKQISFFSTRKNQEVLEECLRLKSMIQQKERELEDLKKTCNSQFPNIQS